jgi:hypothetical protein
MSVAENLLAIGLAQGLTRTIAEAEIDRLLGMFGLSRLREAYAATRFREARQNSLNSSLAFCRPSICCCSMNLFLPCITR